MLVIKFNEDLPDVMGVVDDLKSQGLPAVVDSFPFQVPKTKESIEVFLVGCSVPHHLAILTIKACRMKWPSLRYVHLSSDDRKSIEESDHYRIYVGGTDAYVKQFNLKPWTDDEFDSLEESMGLFAFHYCVRGKYRREDPRTEITCVGGPMDGQVFMMPGPPKAQKRRFVFPVDAVYDFQENEGKYEYVFAGKRGNAKPAGVKPDSALEPGEQRVSLVFRGGFLDGMSFRTDSEDDEESARAKGYLFMTDGGQVGKRFKTISDAAVKTMQTEGTDAARKAGFQMNHKFEVANRQEFDGRVVVTFKYIEPSADTVVE